MTDIDGGVVTYVIEKYAEAQYDSDYPVFEERLGTEVLINVIGIPSGTITFG